MTDELVLVDTCAWIDFLRSKDGGLGDQVAVLISEGRAVLCGVVIAELLQGLKQGLKNDDAPKFKKEAERVQLLIDSLSSFATLELDWVTAGRTLQSLRQNGITVPLTDAIIAAVAKRNNLALLTIDQHFKHLGF
jgi:predicted nucleic acid-binding protein